MAKASALGHRYDLVEILGPQQRRPVPDPAPLDVMGARYASGQYRRLGRLGHHAMERGQLGSQHAGRAQKAAGRANVAAERGDSGRAGELLEQFCAELPVAVEHVGGY